MSYMLSALFVIPITTIVALVLLYRQNGKHEFLRFDLVQFIQSFVVLPMMYVWMKSFLYFLLRHELSVGLSVGELLVIDTIFSLIFLFIYAFTVIHALTASFKLHKTRDPLYDIFHHTEYFHLWLSHLAIYNGTAFITTLFSFANLVTPLEWHLPKPAFYGLLGIGLLLGVFGYIGVWLGDPKQANFMRIMKLSMAFFFSLHVVAYFVFDPQFNSSYGVFWILFMGYLALVFLASFIDKSERASSFFDRFKHGHDWGENIQLFTKPKLGSKTKGST